MTATAQNQDRTEPEMAVEANPPKGYLATLLASRSLAKAPFSTLWRAASYVALTRAHIPASFNVAFGNAGFRMRLQKPKPHYGIASIYVQRRYYEPLLEFGHTLLSPGETVIDGGASQGIYTCAFAAKVGPSGRVYAFKPLAYAVECLRNNITLNGFENVEVFEGALDEKAGKSFIDMTRGPAYASIVHDFGHGSGTEVATFAIDELRRDGRLSKLDFIKLGVEGAELAALKGARDTIGHDKPRLAWKRTRAKSSSPSQASSRPSN